MYAQLGPFKFEGLRGWDAFSRRTEASYAEQPLIENKPRLQKTGNALDVIRFDIQLHSFFADVEDDVNGLRAATINGDVLPLIDGKGVFMGNFVILTIDDMPAQTFGDGTVMHTRLSVELKEYVLPTETVSQGFAANSPKVFSTRQYQSEFNAIMLSGNTATSAATSAGMNVVGAAQGKEGAVAKAQRALKKARDYLNMTRQGLQDAKNAIQAKDRIINDINRTQQALENTRTALSEGNLDGAMEANTQMQNGVSAMNGGLSEVAVYTALRQ